MPEEFVEFSEASETKIGFDWFTQLIEVDVFLGGFHVQFDKLPVNHVRQKIFYPIHNMLMIDGVFLVVYCGKQLRGNTGIETLQVKNCLQSVF